MEIIICFVSNISMPLWVVCMPFTKRRRKSYPQKQERIVTSQKCNENQNIWNKLFIPRDMTPNKLRQADGFIKGKTKRLTPCEGIHQDTNPHFPSFHPCWRECTESSPLQSGCSETRAAPCLPPAQLCSGPHSYRIGILRSLTFTEGDGVERNRAIRRY